MNLNKKMDTIELLKRSSHWGNLELYCSWCFCCSFVHMQLSNEYTFLFVLEFIVPLEKFSLIWRRHHCRLKAANFDLCWALMAIEQ